MTARARGFIEAWRPRQETWELLYRVRGVLNEYIEQLPLTLRQIFYILVGRYGCEKTERSYERLCETLNKARRARVIDMDAVRDDGFTNEIPDFFGSANHFLDAVRVSARLLRLDRQAGQVRRLAMWCEASGMIPQLQRIADPFGRHLAAGAERAELYLETQCLGGLDGHHHVWPRVALDERFDGELEQQHADAL